MSQLEQIAARLGEIAELLAKPELDDEQAEALAREAAELASEAGSALDRRLGEAAGGDRPDG
ncbi:MAG: hypothetical protein QOG09_834 [Solirubrobacterales bacterium]|jgi:hypothetical protein|nr:hypothetical protein [Solirubrobacterales bacterium]MDX6662732.1 hypothetical protein [Solirubrobacterales bacterium]